MTVVAEKVEATTTPQWTRSLNPAELEALSPEELRSYLAWQREQSQIEWEAERERERNRRQAEIEAAPRDLRLIYDQHERANETRRQILNGRRIVTDDDFFLQGDYDIVDGRPAHEWGA